MKPIILLDLNYTLVGNSENKKAPFIRQIEQEEYRRDLIDLVRPHFVVLITARPDKYRTITLNHIKTQTNWQPQEAIFNNTNLAPHLFKPKAIKEMLATKEYNSTNDGRIFYVLKGMIAIESNPRTIEAYKKMEILCLSVK
jgi:hypothetical protein